MFKIFKGYFAAGFGMMVGVIAGNAVMNGLFAHLNSKKVEEETDPDIETEE